jgi:hypothetical protein
MSKLQLCCNPCMRRKSFAFRCLASLYAGLYVAYLQNYAPGPASLLGIGFC